MRSFDSVIQRDEHTDSRDERVARSRVSLLRTRTRTRARPQVRGHVATCLLGRLDALRVTQDDRLPAGRVAERNERTNGRTNERTNELRTVQRPFNPALTFASFTRFSTVESGTLRVLNLKS
jgi:hypothetical protein